MPTTGRENLGFNKANFQWRTNIGNNICKRSNVLLIFHGDHWLKINKQTLNVCEREKCFVTCTCGDAQEVICSVPVYDTVW